MKQPIPFGKYFLLERINVGGMAEVFKAKATGVEGFERVVAVKRILPSIAEDEEFVTMFKDEAKIAVQLSHANIAQIFDLGSEDGSLYIALEYVRGKDLRAIANRVRQRAEQLPTPLTCYVIMKLCEGLDYAHNKHDNAGRFLNLVHRDVSPQNVLVSYEGEVKIIDFGIAKAAGKAGHTQAGILKGKFGYMSPEQVKGLEIDRRSDVFGVGICLYELLTGERPFAAETDFATLEKVRTAEVQPPSTYNPRIPEELDQIVLKALTKDRDLRYQSALAMHDDLQAFMHTSGNLYTRKDLGLYMQRVFADEIKQEDARAAADESDASDPSGGDRVRALDEELAASAEVAEDGWNGSGSEGAPAGDRPDAEQTPAEVRRRTGTLLGVPYATALHAPAVPRPVPGPGSIPPFAAAAPSSRPPEPSRPPLHAVAPELAHAMDWDDEELSTQIYDKPAAADGRLGPRDDDLGALEASVPDSVEPSSGLAPARFTGELPALPPRLSEPPPPAMRLAPPPASAPRRMTTPVMSPHAGYRQAHPLTGQPSRGRPMLAAVITVVGIIVLIVLGLMLYRDREPGTVSLATRPSRVEVSVDGRLLGTSTSPFVIGELTADRAHEIVVSSPGHESWKKLVTLAPGEVLNLTDVTLEPIETGFVLTTDPPEASVFVDDKRLPGRTPLRVTDIAPGEHRLRVERQGYASWESSFGATKGTVLPLPTLRLEALPSSETETEPERSRARSARRSGTSARSTASAHATDSPEDEPAADQPSSHGVVSAAEASGEAEPDEVDEPDREAPSPAAEAPAPSIDELLAQEPEAPALTPDEAPAAQPDDAPSTGKLRVNSRPWSQVFVDGKAYGATPRLNIELAAGSHALRLVNAEFDIEKNMQVVIEAGETQSVVVNLLDD